LDSNGKTKQPCVISSADQNEPNLHAKDAGWVVMLGLILDCFYLMVNGLECLRLQRTDYFLISFMSVSISFLVVEVGETLIPLTLAETTMPFCLKRSTTSLGFYFEVDYS